MVNKFAFYKEEIDAAKAAGYTVQDLNDNSSGLRVRGPNWALHHPTGETVGYGFTEEAAWLTLFDVKEPIKEAKTSALQRVIGERNRQDAKWGEQNHDAGKWSLILTEELGEVAKSQLEGDRTNYLTELVQAAAVLVAWIECEMRKESQ